MTSLTTIHAPLRVCWWKRAAPLLGKERRASEVYGDRALRRLERLCVDTRIASARLDARKADEAAGIVGRRSCSAEDPLQRPPRRATDATPAPLMMTRYQSRSLTLTQALRRRPTPRGCCRLVSSVSAPQSSTTMRKARRR